MIYVCWLLLKGSWAQTMINMSVQAPSSGWSMGYFFGVGLVFAGTAIPLLLYGPAPDGERPGRRA